MELAQDHDALSAVLAATRALLRVTAPSHVADVVSTLVHDLGGGLVPARLADEATAVQIDLSLGLSEPLLPWADPVSLAALRLETVLPGFVEDARLVLADLRQRASDDEHDEHGVTSSAVALEAFFRTMEDVDTRAACELVLALLDEGIPLARIATEVLGPAQVRVGLRWEQGEWSVADEHSATAITEAALAALAQADRPVSTLPGALHVVLACAEGEWHAFPARMVAALAASPGVRITMLGPSLPADQLGRRLATGDVDLLALSCTMPSNLVGAARCIDAAHAQGVPVLAGGRAFGVTSQRAFAVGADAWSNDPAALLATPPALAGRERRISPEVLFLDSVDAGVLGLVHRRLMVAFPSLPQLRTDQSDVVEDLRSLARFTAAAVLTDDAGIIDELLAWLGRHNRVPAAVVATSARLLAEALEPSAPEATRLLHDAAERFEHVV